jgi:SET domain-containing protein
MSPPGRPKGESLSAQREGSPMSPPGRPKGESLSAQREDGPVSDPLPRAAPVYVKHTGTPKGRGVFAASAIGAGELIETCPVIRLHTPYPQLPSAIQQVVFHWSVLAKLPGVSAIALGWGSLYNHANPANARYQASADGKSLIISAARDIAADEEITINYNAAAGEPSSTEDNWFDERGIELYDPAAPRPGGGT